jgi:hypothetical protein
VFVKLSFLKCSSAEVVRKHPLLAFVARCVFNRQWRAAFLQPACRNAAMNDCYVAAPTRPRDLGRRLAHLKGIWREAAQRQGNGRRGWASGRYGSSGRDR